MGVNCTYVPDWTCVGYYSWKCRRSLLDSSSHGCCASPWSVAISCVHSDYSRLSQCAIVCRSWRPSDILCYTQQLPANVRRHLGQTPSDLCQELLGADTHGSKCFQCHSEEVVGAAECCAYDSNFCFDIWRVTNSDYLLPYLFVPFSDSCSFSGTCTGDGILLQVSVSQSADHCDVPSGTVPRVPWQQCQTVRPLAVVTYQPAWFLHARNAGSSLSAPDDVINVVCDVVFCSSFACRKKRECL